MNACDILRLVNSLKDEMRAKANKEERARLILCKIDEEISKAPAGLSFVETMNDEYQIIVASLRSYVNGKGKNFILRGNDKYAIMRTNKVLQEIYSIVEK